MIVTHLLQVLAVVAMEPPPSLEPRALVDEKLKVFRSLLPIEPEDVVRGQYEGYRDEAGVAADSDVETFIAARVEVDNWRWAGVPFYLRTGKRMAESARVISIAFREPPKSMFPPDAGVGGAGPDHLTFDLADTPRLSLSFYGKRPGRGHASREGEHAVLARRDPAAQGRAGGVRAADPRRHDRRSHALHDRRGRRAAVGDLRAAARAALAAAAIRPGLLGARARSTP